MGIKFRKLVTKTMKRKKQDPSLNKSKAKEKSFTSLEKLSKKMKIKVEKIKK
jgi:hypothetical protein